LASNHNNNSSSGGEGEASRSKWAELLSGALEDNLAELDLLNNNNKRLEEEERECHSRTNNLEPFREQLVPPSNNNLDRLRGQPSNPPSSSLEGVSPAHSHSSNSSLEDKGGNNHSSSKEVEEGLTGAVVLVDLLALPVDSHRVVEVPVP
jgi:hypothetical protein